MGVEGTEGEFDLAQRVTELERSHIILRNDIDANTRLTTSVKEDTAILVDFATGLQGFAKFIHWCGKSIKWLGMYVAPIVAVGVAIFSIKSGNPPPKP